MLNAILPSFFHVSSGEWRNFHTYCEKSSTSWCQYQRDIVNGTNLYSPGSGLPKIAVFRVTPIYYDIVNPAELRKCLHGETQNKNESFNSLIW